MPSRARLVHREGRTSKLLQEPPIGPDDLLPTGELRTFGIGNRRRSKSREQLEAARQAQALRTIAARERRDREQAERQRLDLSPRPPEFAAYHDGRAVVVFEVVWNGR